jgi:hypothetical protein
MFKYALQAPAEELLLKERRGIQLGKGLWMHVLINKLYNACTYKGLKKDSLTSKEIFTIQNSLCLSFAFSRIQISVSRSYIACSQCSKLPYYTLTRPFFTKVPNSPSRTWKAMESNHFPHVFRKRKASHF